MNEKIQRSIFNYFSKNGIENFVGVPDSTMKYFIEQGLEQKKILITTREEEATKCWIWKFNQYNYISCSDV